MQKRRQGIYFLCMLLLCLNGCSGKETAVIFESEEQEIQEENSVSELETEVEKPSICVYVCGQVMKPGVYELSEDARVTDAIIAAGGMTEEADQTYLNQAAFVEDGQKIYVPAVEELDVMNNGVSGKISLNRAGIAELTTLTGVGVAKAKAIIQYRESNGGFKSIEEIMNIEGIKEGVFDRIKDEISVE